MLTLLQLVDTFRDQATGVINKEGIKAVYIAPMKALAQEVVTKFAERLGPLGLKVREFTGEWLVVIVVVVVICMYIV